MNRENSSRLSRRTLLAGLGIGAAAAGAYASPALQLDWTRKPGPKASWWDRQFTSLSRAGIDEWSRQIGTEFALGGGAVVRLAEVGALGPAGQRPAGVRDRAFVLAFEPVAGALPAGDRILDVVHAEAGTMKIYFSSCDGNRLQAVFA
jgi:hypothetical protein